MTTLMQALEPSRREFVGGAAAAIGLAAAGGAARAAAAQPKYRRVNVNSDAAKSHLKSYQKAIGKMLALPASDARNWYRNALVHTVDCPHGNWWFLVWHRGYIGWFEQICRELSEDPNFALPYWDWTENVDGSTPFVSSVPDRMYDGVLTPTDPSYIGTYDAFKATVGGVVDHLIWWNRTMVDGNLVPDAPYGQLLARGIRFPDDLWFDIADDPRGLLFFERAHARGLSRQEPQLDPGTTKNVSLPTLLDALSPRDFIGFGSPKTYFHSGLTGFGILEGLPHNSVHNCVGGAYNGNGGFMQANLSPVDPLFFLHHANIDRIWDVWTRKQLARGYPILPDGYPSSPGGAVRPGSDYDRWSRELFLFYADAQGHPVTKVKAGDYASIGDFDYDYEPGSGEEVVPGTQVAAGAAVPPTERYAGSVAAGTISAATTASAAIAVPEALLTRAGPGGATLVAEVTVAFPPLGHGGAIAVLVNAPAGGSPPSADSPHFAGVLSMFGHHTAHGPVTFTVPLTSTLLMLRSATLLSATAPLTVSLAPIQPGGPAAGATGHAHPGAQAELLAVTVTAL